MEARQFHICFVSHVEEGLVFSELLKIIKAIIKGGVSFSGLPPVTFAVAIYELCQIIVNIHILSFQRTIEVSRPATERAICTACIPGRLE